MRRLVMISAATLACRALAGTVCIAPTMGDETTAIQSAIDNAYRAGGGKVVVSAGEHKVRSLRLRSNVELHLAANAVLSASRNCDDYDILLGDKIEPIPAAFVAAFKAFDPKTPRDRTKPWINASNPLPRWNYGVVRIVCATNVVLSGEAGSAIDGNNSYDPNGEEHYRGAHGINCFYSTNVVVRGITLRNTGNWATRFAYSADLVFADLTIRGGHDGVHVRGCDRVNVSKCDIQSGDDAIAGFDNADVTVEDCSLNTACSAFRFGGTRVRVRRCRAWGPAVWPFRGTMSQEDKCAGVSSQGRGRPNLLSFWTYFADFSQPMRNPPGDIVVEDCVIENADRLLHYNFSGNETWQKGAPLGDIRFVRCRATGIGQSLCAYASADRPFSLALCDCGVTFRAPVSEFVRAAHVKAVELERTCVRGVNGPCVRTWAGAPNVKVENSDGIGDKVEKATQPFKTRAI